MKTKIAIIAFGEFASVVAHFPLWFDHDIEITGRTCVHGLTTKEDAEICARNIRINHKEGESYLIISGSDEVSQMYAAETAAKLPEYPVSTLPIYNERLAVTEHEALEEGYGLPKLQRAIDDLWKKARPKNSKLERKEFRGNRKFGVGFFTPGTKCIVDVEGGRHEGQREINVVELVSNAPNSYVAVTDVWNEFTEMNDGYHISHVVEIISHQPGKLKFKPDYYSKDRNKDLERDSDSSGTGLKPKHHSQYRTYSVRSLLITLLRDEVKYDQVLDFTKLEEALLNQNVFHIDTFGEERWGMKVYTVSKKKLQKAIRRLFNKCLTPLFAAEVAWRKADEEYYRSEMEHDDGDEIEDTSDDSEEMTFNPLK